MKVSRLISEILLCTLATFAMALSASARVPEPDALWWGTLTHNNGQALVPNGGTPITVVAKYNGVEVARNSVPNGSTTYVLKVPVDDGMEPRVPGTLRPGERVHIFLRNTASNTEYETTQTLTGPSVNGLIGSARGTVYTLNLSVQQDLGTGAPIAAAFGLWATTYPSIQPSLSSNDSDGDGVSDFEEFLADTDPTLGSSRLRILEVAHASQVTSIKFGPLRIGRIYTVLHTDTLANPTWHKVGEVIPSANATFTWFDHAAPATQGFYRVEVGIH